MKRYAAICALAAALLLPGSLPILVGVVAYRAIKRVRFRRQAKRIVVAAGGWRPEYRGEA